MQKRSELPIVFAPILLNGKFPSYSSAKMLKDSAPLSFLHYHDAIEIGICHEGAGIILVGEKILSYRKGDVTYITPNEVHFSQSAAGIRSLWTWLHCRPEELLAPFDSDAEILQVSRLYGPEFDNIVSHWAGATVAEAAKRIESEMEERKPFYQNTVRSLYYLFFGAICRSLPAGKPLMTKPVAPDQRRALLSRIHPALDHMRRNFREKISVSDLAKLCFMSEVNFRRVFRRAVGRGPLEYLLNVRISMAMSEIGSSSKAMSWIAASNGFASVSSFNRKFKEIAGLSPLNWRKQGSGRCSEPVG